MDSEPLMNIIPPSRTPLVVHVTKLFPSHPAGKLPCVLSWNSMVHAIKVFSHPLQSSLVNENAPLISAQRSSRREPPHSHVTFSASSSSAHKQLRTVPKAKKRPKKKDPELPSKDYDVRVAPLIVCDVFMKLDFSLPPLPSLPPSVPLSFSPSLLSHPPSLHTTTEFGLRHLLQRPLQGEAACLHQEGW